MISTLRIVLMTLSETTYIGEDSDLSAVDYVVVLTKTTISIELLFRTEDKLIAETILPLMVHDICNEIGGDLLQFTTDLRTTASGMKKLGLFDSLQFQKLVIRTKANDSIPDMNDHEEFYEFCVRETQRIFIEQYGIRPEGTRLN